MTWFRNRRTMTKMMLLVGGIAMLVAGVAWQSLRSMNAVEEDVNQMERHATGMSDLKNARGEVLRIARAVRNAIIDAAVSEMTRMDKHVEDIKRSEAGFIEAFGAFEKTLVSADTTAKAAGVQAQFREVRQAQDKVVALAKAGNVKEARDTVIQVRQRVDRLEEDIAWLAQRKEAQLKQAAQAADGEYHSARTAVLVTGAVAVVLAGFLGVFIARMIAAPLTRASAVFGEVAAGNLTRRLAAETADEVGDMSRAFNGLMERFHDVMVEVRRASEGVAGASQQLAGATQQLSSGAQEQASSLEETAASLEEMTGTVKQNADNTAQADRLAVGARGTAEQGGQVVGDAVQSMEEINRASKQIAAIITTIDEIAFQTNLLALNAAVEAARAGEQGRGFAVVASEVRNLAQRSATAAKEIKGLIENSVGKVQAGSELVNRAGQTLGEIVGAVKKVTDVIAEIAAASREQSQGVDQVNRAVAQMDQVVQSNAAQTEELSSTAQAMAGQAEQLRTLVAQFTLAGGGGAWEGREMRPSRPAPVVVAPRGAARPGSAAPGTARPRADMQALAAAKSTDTNGSARADGFEEF